MNDGMKTSTVFLEKLKLKIEISIWNKFLIISIMKIIDKYQILSFPVQECVKLVNSLY